MCSVKCEVGYFLTGENRIEGPREKDTEENAVCLNGGIRSLSFCVLFPPTLFLSPVHVV